MRPGTPKGGASSFDTEDQADAAVADALRSAEARVAAWVTDETRPGPVSVRSDLDRPTGRWVPRGGTEVREVSGVRVVLAKDPQMPTGYRVETAYPVPAQGQIGVGVEDDLPALAQLCGAGLNQDFWEVDGSPEAVVDRLAEDPSFVAGLPRDVTHLRRLVDDDPASLDAVLDGLGNNYDYVADGLSVSQWLEQVVARVAGRSS